MTMANAINGSRTRFGGFEVASDPCTGEASLVFVPGAIWERVPASARKAAGDIDIWLQDGEPVNCQLPIDAFERLRSDIEAAGDLLLAESAEQLGMRGRGPLLRAIGLPPAGLR